MDNKTISKIKEINPNLTKEEKISEIKRSRSNPKTKYYIFI